MKKNLVFQYNNDLDLKKKQGFIFWVIGHELGHLILKHKKGDFNEKPLDEFVSNTNYLQVLEVQADSFSISKISVNEEFEQIEVLFLLDMLNSEIYKKTPQAEPYYGVGIHYNFYSNPAIEYSKQGTHPEYIIRLVRNLEQIAHIKKDVGMEYQLSKLVENFKSRTEM